MGGGGHERADGREGADEPPAGRRRHFGSPLPSSRTRLERVDRSDYAGPPWHPQPNFIEPARRGGLIRLPTMYNARSREPAHCAEQARNSASDGLPIGLTEQRPTLTCGNQSSMNTYDDISN